MAKMHRDLLHCLELELSSGNIKQILSLDVQCLWYSASRTVSEVFAQLK